MSDYTKLEIEISLLKQQYNDLQTDFMILTDLVKSIILMMNVLEKEGKKPIRTKKDEFLDYINEITKDSPPPTHKTCPQCLKIHKIDEKCECGFVTHIDGKNLYAAGLEVGIKMGRELEKKQKK